MKAKQILPSIMAAMVIALSSVSVSAMNPQTGGQSESSFTQQTLSNPSRPIIIPLSNDPKILSIPDYKIIYRANSFKPKNVTLKRNTYGSGYEADQARKLLGNFDYMNSRAYTLMMSIVKSSAKMKTGKPIVLRAVQLAINDGRRLTNFSRMYKRVFPLLIKYVEENFDILQYYIPLAYQQMQQAQQIQ